MHRCTQKTFSNVIIKHVDPAKKKINNPIPKMLCNLKIYFAWENDRHP